MLHTNNGVVRCNTDEQLSPLGIAEGSDCLQNCVLDLWPMCLPVNIPSKARFKLQPCGLSMLDSTQKVVGGNLRFDCPDAVFIEPGKSSILCLQLAYLGVFGLKLPLQTDEFRFGRPFNLGVTEAGEFRNREDGDFNGREIGNRKPWDERATRCLGCLCEEVLLSLHSPEVGDYVITGVSGANDGATAIHYGERVVSGVDQEFATVEERGYDQIARVGNRPLKTSLGYVVCI